MSKQNSNIALLKRKSKKNVKKQLHIVRKHELLQLQMIYPGMQIFGAKLILPCKVVFPNRRKKSW